jgi:arginase
MDIQLINFPMKHGCHTPGADQSFTPLKESGWCDINTSIVHHVPIIPVSDVILEHDQTIMNASQYHRDLVNKIYKEHHFPLSFGGDHTCGIGGTSASISTFHNDVTILWLDAHADSHTPQSSPSKHIHGMPCAILQNLCPAPLKIGDLNLSPENLIYVGLNSYEAKEIEHIQSKNISHITLKQIQEIGIEKTLNWISEHIKTKYVYFSFDFDVLHPDEFYSVNVNAEKTYSSGQGLKLNEALTIMTHLFTAFSCVGCDVVEYNPLLDQDSQDFNKVLLTLDHLVSLIKENPYDTSTF